MKFTIITATYNSEKTIIDTLLSLDKQTYNEIEYIIIDGNSKDHTLELIQQNCSRVTRIISEPDLGIYDALNKGIAAATGDVIGFLHSDDIYTDDDVIEKVSIGFSDDTVDAVYGDLDYVSKDNASKIIRRWSSGEFKLSNMRNGWMPPHPTFFMRRECYKKFGGFDLSYHIAADYDSLLRYLWVNKIKTAYIPSVLIKMRVGGESNRSLSNIIKKTKEDIRAMRSNNLPFFRAILGKNFSKLPQFFLRK